VSASAPLQLFLPSLKPLVTPLAALNTHSEVRTQP